MAADSSFDVVSQINRQELVNAVDQVSREIGTRFDLKATGSTVTLEKDSGVICLELMKRVQDAGYRLVEVPVHHYHRAYGTSQFFNFRRLARVARDLLLLWYALVVRRTHERADVTPLADRAADPSNRVYPTPPRS